MAVRVSVCFFFSVFLAFVFAKHDPPVPALVRVDVVYDPSTSMFHFNDGRKVDAGEAYVSHAEFTDNRKDYG